MPVPKPEPASAPAPASATVLATNDKNPLLAAILSFFIPGLGQAYNGQIKKGIVMFVAVFGSVIAVFFAQLLSTILLQGLGCLCLFAYLIPLLIWAFNIYDAYQGAQGKGWKL